MPPPDPSAIGTLCLGLHVRRAARAVSRLYDEAFAPLGLSGGQFSLLTALASRGGLRMGQLAELLGMDHSTLTAAIRPLARRGLVATSPDPEDRRVRRIALTAAGDALAAEARPRWAAAQARAEALVGGHDADGLRKALAAMSRREATGGARG
jgi:DNA-binding MarR family transcriptional regulator